MSLCGGNLHLLPAQPSVCSSQERRAWGLRTSRPSAEVTRGQRGPCHSSLEPQLLSTGGHTTVTSVAFVHTDKSQCGTPSLLINTPASPLGLARLGIRSALRSPAAPRMHRCTLGIKKNKVHSELHLDKRLPAVLESCSPAILGGELSSNPFTGRHPITICLPARPLGNSSCPLDTTMSPW